MSDQVLAALGLCANLLGLAMLRYAGTSPAAWFTLAWALAATWTTIFFSSSPDYPMLASVAQTTATLSIALHCGGVLILVERAPGRWFLPAMFSLGLARSLLVWQGPFELGAVWLGQPVTALAAAVGFLAWRDPPRPGPTLAYRLLATTVAAFVVINLVTDYSLTRDGSLSATLVASWILLVPALLGTQVYALAEYRSLDLRRRAESLEQKIAERTREISRINESLAHSEERYRTVSELSSDFSFALRMDRDGHVEREWVTEAFERITGYPPETLDGSGWAILLHGDQRSITADDVRFVHSLPAQGRIEYPVVRPDGETRWLEVVFRSETGADGTLRAVGAARDVTDARAAEEARRDLERQVERAQRSESLGVVTGGIAHDFNNLLAVILGNARLARDELPPESPASDKLSRLQDAAEAAAHLTQQMLASSGSAPLSLAALELQGFIEETHDALRARVGPHCKLELQLGEAVEIRADATRLRQVLVDLVTNAHEALEGRAGQITVRSGHGPVDRAGLARAHGAESAQPGDYAWLEVIDNGTGIDAETRARIFDPFFSTRFSGRGLGLASVLGTLRAHGGGVDIQSEPGRGTRVRILLPVPDGSATQSAAAPAAQRVLVVDDDEAVLELASEFLRRAGFESHRASGGAVAIDVFARKCDEIDVVVLDLTMPGMDGREVFEQLRRIRPDLPVVLATGYSRGTIEERFPDEKQVSVLRKPYEPEQLIDAIRAAHGEAV